MGQRRPRRLNTITRYDCPREFAHLAEGRTAKLRKTWGNWGEDSLSRLCQSCYLQGVADALEAAEHKKQ